MIKFTYKINDRRIMYIDENSNKKFINYDMLINRLITHMIRNVLRYISDHGLPGKHHFYIKFALNHPEVLVQDMQGNQDLELIAKHGTEMTIVLQNSFDSLKVMPNNFSLILNFNASPRKLTIPFDSLLTFHDPFANFAVRLEPTKYKMQSDYIEFDEYEDYNFADEDEDDEIGKILEYDYEKYKIDETKKIVYFDELQKKINS